MTTLDEREAAGLGVALPGAPAYAEATRTFNLAAPVAPAAAVTARTVDDVVAAVAYARAQGLKVRTFTTGHAAATFAPMTDSLLIRTELAGEVTVTGRTARVPAGAVWGDVVAATSPQGLVAAHGTSATVGVVGYLLRGGVSFYGRHLGLAPNTVTAVELVTADGAPRRVSADDDPELFWALRGGGGGFGVVTAVEVRLHEVPKVITGAAFWAGEHAEAILSLWREWALTAPTTASTSLRLMNLPPLPSRPEAISSGPTVALSGAVLSETADLTEARAVYNDLLGPLRAVADPVFDTWHEDTPDAVPRSHLDPPVPVLAMGDHLLLDDPGPAGLAEFLHVAGGDSPLLAAELRQLGGQLATPCPTGGVYDHVPAAFLYQCVGPANTPEALAASRAKAAAVRAALAPWDTGRTIPSFVGSTTQPQGHLTAAQRTSVDGIRGRVDPDGLFAGDVLRSTPGT